MKTRQLMLALSLTAAATTASAQLNWAAPPFAVPTSNGMLQIGSVTRTQADGSAYNSIAAYVGKHVTYAPIFGEFEFVQAALAFPTTVVVLATGTDPADYLEDDPYFRYYYYSHYAALFRFNLDGSLDKSFNGTGRVVFAVPPDAPFVGKYTIDGNYEKGDIHVYNGDGLELLRIDGSGGIHTNAIVPVPVTEVSFVTLVEYSNDRSQYFMTGDPGEFSMLDSYQTPGWVRTGFAFHAYPAGSTKGMPVCRFYGGPDPTRPSHFFTADPAECNGLANDPSHSWALESREVFRLDVPDRATGTCAAGRPIYRLLAPWGDATHRFTDSEAVREDLLVTKWRAEGFGPTQVALCAAP